MTRDSTRRESTRDTTRRKFVAGLTATVALGGLAGCSTDDGAGGSTTESMGDGTTTTGDSMDGGAMGTDSMGTDSMGTDSMETETTADGSMDGGSMGETTDDSMGGDSMGTETPTSSKLALSVSDLPELARGHYEGWAVFGDRKVSTGAFAAGDDLTFQVGRDLTAADRIVVTIEPDDDASGAPSGVVVLAGDLSAGSADLSFPVDFAGAAGSYILATPTNGVGSDEKSGVWFLDPGSPKSASLDLPSLPGGWTYEGWVVFDGRPVSTGRFDDPAMADGSMAYVGSAQSPPPFPGADFLTNAPMDLSFPTDLSGERVVVSVEPDVDGSDPTGAKPFPIKPLSGTVPTDATDHTSYELRRKMGTVPAGTAVVDGMG